MSLVFNMLLTVVFGGTGFMSICQETLYTAGLWKLFQMCGQNPWHSLIPCYKQYRLAMCVDREADGNALFILSLLQTLMNVLALFATQVDEAVILAAAVFSLLLLMVELIYKARVSVEICKVFHLKAIWKWLLVLLSAVAMPLLGWIPKYRLQAKQELAGDGQDGEGERRAPKLDKGLTVNLRKREAQNMMSRKTLLKDIHMAIQPGHMVLLLGGSGAGKTTLVNAINGYEEADAEVLLDGTNIYKAYGQMKYKVGFVPQGDLMRGQDTVLHTLKDAARLRMPGEVSAEERNQRVQQVMDIFGLGSVSGSMVSKLSGGQRKRLSIAMEFIPNPELFILDEPDSGLDGVMARELMQQLRDIADQGRIVIVITHTPDRVIDLFDDVIVLAKDCHRTGRLAWFGPVQEARRFFGRDQMEQIVRCINRTEEGGEGRADEFIRKFGEVSA